MFMQCLHSSSHIAAAIHKGIAQAGSTNPLHIKHERILSQRRTQHLELVKDLRPTEQLFALSVSTTKSSLMYRLCLQKIWASPEMWKLFLCRCYDALNVADAQPAQGLQNTACDI